MEGEGLKENGEREGRKPKGRGKPASVHRDARVSPSLRVVCPSHKVAKRVINKIKDKNRILKSPVINDKLNFRRRLKTVEKQNTARTRAGSACLFHVEQF